MDPIKVRDRLQAARTELNDAEVAVYEMARAIIAGAAKGWTTEQRRAAYWTIVREMGRLPQDVRFEYARAVIDEAKCLLRAYTDVPF